MKSKHTEHEQEIIKVREDLSLAINQKLTNMCERVNVDVELGYFSNEGKVVNPILFLNSIKSFNTVSYTHLIRVTKSFI